MGYPVWTPSLGRLAGGGTETLRSPGSSWLAINAPGTVTKYLLGVGEAGPYRAALGIGELHVAAFFWHGIP